MSNKPPGSDPEASELEDQQDQPETQVYDEYSISSDQGSKSEEQALLRAKSSEYANSLKESVLYWQGNDTVPRHLSDVKKMLTNVAGLGDNFDVNFRELSFSNRKMALFYLSGFANEPLMDLFLMRLSLLDKKQIDTNLLQSYIETYITHVQAEKVTELSVVIAKVLQGNSAMFIDHEGAAIVMDTRKYPARGPEEPSLEKVIRGSRDGFTESLMQNIGLVRRRIRDPGLKVEITRVGRRTETDVVVMYIDDIADLKLVKNIRKKIDEVDLFGLPLADKQLEEAIFKKGWNPYPLVRYSERPDTVAAHLLDGNVVLMVDTSPSVMIMPTTFFDLCQHAEENRQTPFIGSYLRWVRFVGIFASLFLLPLWLLLVTEPGLKPPELTVLGPNQNGRLPLLMQFLLAEFGLDLMRMASVHTPTPLATAMSLVAAILIGDVAVKTGVFVQEVILYTAVAGIGMFATPSYELSLANRIVRLLLLIAVTIFKVPGLVVGITLFIVWLATHRSYNSSYLWPFIPFNAKAMYSVIIRLPVTYSKDRPSFNKTRDNTKMRKAKK
ncbi:spore germination protein [Paenibacillus marinisediminis]